MPARPAARRKCLKMNDLRKQALKKRANFQKNVYTRQKKVSLIAKKSLHFRGSVLFFNYER
jgi:hypothetical protein